MSTVNRSTGWRGSAVLGIVLLGSLAAGPVAPEAKLTATDATAFDTFGWAVAISGDTAVVGANSKDTGAGPFVRTGSTWTHEKRLLASDGNFDDQFGRSVALAGNTALVGSPNHDTAAGQAAGSAYAFVRSGGTWTELTKLAAPDAAPVDRLGNSVGISLERAVVGAPRDDTRAGRDAGSTYVFHATAAA